MNARRPWGAPPATGASRLQERADGSQSVAGGQGSRGGVVAVRPEQPVARGEEVLEHGGAVTLATGIRVDDELGFGGGDERRSPADPHE